MHYISPEDPIKVAREWDALYQSEDPIRVAREWDARYQSEDPITPQREPIDGRKTTRKQWKAKRKTVDQTTKMH